MNKSFKVILAVLLCGGLALLKTMDSQAIRKNRDNAANTAIASQAQPTCAPVPTPNPNPPTPPAPFLSAAIPQVVDLGSGAGLSGPADAQWFFDTFSWQSFIAINWPAAVDQNGVPLRGVPNTAAGINPGSPGTRVWESWKADWELFRPYDPSTKAMGVPTDWSSYALNPPATPCAGTNLARGAKLLAQATKMDSLIPDFNQAFSSPLIGQNQLYVRYEIRFNQTGYTTVTQNGWYAKLPANQPVQFPMSPANSGPGAPYGIIEIKAAWRELAPSEDDSRYYWTNTTVLDPGNPQTCRAAKVALVGLHIGHKTSLQKAGSVVGGLNEWVWSTFEQIDNVKDGTPGQAGTFAFNNGQSAPTTNCPSPNQTQNCGYNYKPPKQNATQPFPPINQRTPVQVTRVTPISSTTAAINAKFKQFLISQLGPNTVWQYYQLVATQWPTVLSGKNFDPSDNGAYPFNCDCPFPNDHVANTTAETYFQQFDQNTGLGNSCLSCHFGAASTDFSWTLANKHGTGNKPPNAALANRTARRSKPGSPGLMDAARQKAQAKLRRQ